jgi:hypothetical protein
MAQTADWQGNVLGRGNPPSPGSGWSPIVLVLVIVLGSSRCQRKGGKTATSTITITSTMGVLPHVTLGRSHPASDWRIRCRSISNNSSIVRIRSLAWAINFDGSSE